MATLTVSATHDYTGENLGSDPIDQILYTATATATFTASQFGIGNGLIANNVLLTGNSGQNQIVVNAISGTLSAAGWQFASWGGGDAITLNGTGSDDTITGSSVNDLIDGGGGTDNLSGGPGTDTFVVHGGSLTAGNAIDGGSGNDTLQLLGGAENLTLAGTTVNNVELFAFAGNNGSLIANGSNFGGTGFNAVSGNTANTQTLTVNGNSVDLSAVTFISWGGANQTININGTSGISNTLTGSSQNDTITGTGNSSDVMTGGGGSDTLNGGGGNDFFNYTAANQASNDIISGGASTDTITLNYTGVNDFRFGSITSVEALDFQTGNASATFSGTQIGSGAIAAIDGSSGTDTLTVTTLQPGTATVDLSGVTFTNWTDGIDVITINGSNGADTLTGSSHADQFNESGGVDTFNGGGGDDVFSFTVRLSPFPAGVTVNGGNGTDTLFVNGRDFSQAILSNLEVLTYQPSAQIGGVYATLLGSQLGSGAIATVNGTSGANILSITADPNVDLSAVTFNNWTPADSYAGWSPVQSNTDVILITGTAAGQTIIGSSTNDTITGGGGDDSIDGGPGVDYAIYSGPRSSYFVTYNLDGTITVQDNRGGFPDGTDTVFHIENLQFSDMTINTALADVTASNVVLTNTAINYTINNTGNAAGGASTAGIYLSTDSTITTSDTLIATHTTPGLAVGGSDAEGASLSFPTNLTPGTYYVGAIADYTGQLAESNETNNASVGVPVILGNDSVNTLTGTASNDVILGLGGDDTLIGGAGNNTIDGGAGRDTVDYSNNPAPGHGLAVDLGAGTASNGVNINDTLTSIENVIDTSIDDILIGSSADNHFSGGAGNNTIDGRAGSDTVDYSNNPAPGHGITVDLGAGTASNGVNINDALTSIENVIGTSIDDIIAASTAINTLTGNGGNDVFVFHGGGANGDTVTDFNGQGAAQGDSLEFVGYGTAAHGANLTQVDATHWSINSADGLTHEIITLSNGANVHSTDILFL